MTALTSEPPSPPAPAPAAPLPAWNERHGPEGSIRPAWAALLEALDELGPQELQLRAENGRRMLREHGVTCFVGDDAGERDVPWEVDFIPYLLEASEWRLLEAAVLQRARLLNLILGDLHGQQRLVRDGLVPAPLLYANPSYLRACQAVPAPGGVYLHTYAVDLARAPDGCWWVLADRTQAPAGFGFALENRSVLSRILPEVMQRLRPRSPTAMLHVRRAALRRLAPSGADTPMITLLTPGPRSEAYFEHAYLARLLGFTLVEGGDLTVRDRRVFLKTLEGLRPVEVILRRVHDAFCDPLELRGDSFLGIAGLVDATRAGTVAVANALGAGLLESPAFMPFLPGLCRHLLGEEVVLPSVATWWCGQVREWNHARVHLDELVIRSAFGLGTKPVLPGQLDEPGREQLRAALHSNPQEFVAQERVLLSRAPAFDGPDQPLTLRLFAFHAGHDYAVMPGGLARLLPQASMYAAPTLLAGQSKDVWVLPDDAGAPEAAPIVVTPSPAVERAASDLPSRAAENFYWLGRYVERLESALRVCRCLLGHLMEDLAPDGCAALAGLLGGLGVAKPGSEGPAESAAELRAFVLAQLGDAKNPSGIQPLLARIKLAAFSVRDRLSTDTWRILNRLVHVPELNAGHLPLVRAADTVNALVLQLLAFSGLEMENMTRGHGWVFLDLGRRLERSIRVAHLVSAGFHPALPPEWLLGPLLEIADSVMTYRRRYFAEPQRPGVLDLLLLDASNPRSLAFQLTALVRLAGDLPDAANPPGVALVRERLDGLQARLAGQPSEGALAELAGISEELGAVSDLLTEVFFSHVVPRVS